MGRGFAAVLDECLAAISRGETLEDCLARYPKHAEELRTHLLLAQRLGATPHHQPRPSAQAVGWAQFRTRAEDMQLGRRPRISLNLGWMRPLAIAAAVVLAVLAAGGATVYASQDALPDSPLYRVKLASEDVRVWLTFSDTSKAELLLDQSSERTEEIMELLRDGKAVPGNVLDAVRNRNARAVRILEDRPEEQILLTRARDQSAAQEALLLGLWGNLEDSARDDFAEAVATLHNARLRTSGLPGSLTPDDLAAGVINITGFAQEAADGVWLVGGVEVRLDSRTLGETDLESGQAANVVAARGANGRLLALNVAVADGQVPDQQYVVSGALEEVDGDEVVIAGQRIAITERTLLKLRLERGGQVEITVEEIGGRAVASTVEGPGRDRADTPPALLVYEGIIEGDVSIAAVNNEWIVGGQMFMITPTTEIDAQGAALARDARARIEAVLVGDELVARRVTLLAPDPDKDVIVLEGVFEGSDQGRWTVSGVDVEAPPDVETPERGSLVTLGGRRDGGRLVGERLTATFQPGRGGLAQLRGIIGAVEDDGTLQVGFARVRIGTDTVISGEPQAGSRVFVWGSREGADSFQAVYVNILDRQPLVPRPGAQD